MAQQMKIASPEDDAKCLGKRISSITRAHNKVILVLDDGTIIEFRSMMGVMIWVKDQ